VHEAGLAPCADDFPPLIFKISLPAEGRRAV